MKGSDRSTSSLEQKDHQHDYESSLQIDSSSDRSSSSFLSLRLTIVIRALLDLVNALLPYLGVPIAGRAAVVLYPLADTKQHMREEEEKNKKTINKEMKSYCSGKHNSQKLIEPAEEKKSVFPSKNCFILGDH